MTDFDPDAYLQGSDSSASFDPDAYLSQPAPRSSPKSIDATPAMPSWAEGISHAKQVARIVTKHPFSLGVGAAENALSAVTGGVGSLADAVTLSEPGTHDWAYRPRTEAGQELAAAGAQESNAMGRGFSGWAAQGPLGNGPLVDTIKRYGPEALGAIGTVTGAAGVARAALGAGAPPETPSSTLDSPQSLGAARATYDIDNASPLLQRAIRQAAQKGGNAVNPVALENHLEADQHGVQLTEGQATRDPIQFSNEQNSTHLDIVKRISVQNQQLTDAIDSVRRDAAPATVQNDPIENGQIAVDALKAYDEPIKADINAKYQAAKEASAKGDLQMDGSTFVDEANKALKPQSKFRFLPGTVKGILDDVANADGKMTLDDFQAYSTQLSNEIAKAKAAGDGNAAFAIGKVNEALQKINPIGEETAQAKALFDTARATAKARFDELDADPAYRAAVDDVSLNGVKKGEPSALADKFLDKYALQAPKANVDRLMGKLDADSQQAVIAHTLSTIRKSAVTPNGTVSPNGFNTAIAKYGPKLDSLLPDEATRESLDSLGRVITNVKVPPPGHFVNYSKSGVIMNAAQGVAKGVGQAALNAKTFGLGVPVIKGMAENSFARRALAPGAGLTQLPPSPP